MPPMAVPSQHKGRGDLILKQKGKDKMVENKVRGLIYTWYPSLAAFAKEVGWARQKAAKIASGEQEPSLDDIHAIAKATNKDADFVASIFLAQASQNR